MYIYIYIYKYIDTQHIHSLQAWPTSRPTTSWPWAERSGPPRGTRGGARSAPVMFMFVLIMFV